MELNEVIRAQRLALGLTLDDVGRAVGVNRSTVQRWESGSITNLKRDKIAMLAFVLRVSPEYLLGWSSDPVRKVEDDLEVACAGLNRPEREQVLRYVQFIKSQRGASND